MYLGKADRCLPNFSVSQAAPYNFYRIIGYLTSIISVGETSTVPRHAQIQVLREERCRQLSEWNKFFDVAQMCAGYKFGGMPCDVRYYYKLVCMLLDYYFFYRYYR